MKIGFTGTRHGMRPCQWQQTDRLFRGLTGATALHFGGARGADFQARKIAVSLGLKTHRHPCDLAQDQVITEDDEVLEVKAPLVRNRDIVDVCDLLVATPDGEEVQRSGTWSTVRYARRQKKPLVIVYPDGKVVWEKELPKT